METMGTSRTTQQQYETTYIDTQLSITKVVHASLYSHQRSPKCFCDFGAST